MKGDATYGFVADPDKTDSHNLAIQLSSQSTYLLSSRPSNLACHNLCNHRQPPKYFQSLASLGLGLNFCPTPSHTTGLKDFQWVSDRFWHDLYTQMIFAHKDDDYDPKQLFIPSDWEPSPANIPIEFQTFVSHFLKLLHEQFHRQQVPSNLATFQASLPTKPLNSDDFQVPTSDKNLGCCIIKRFKYITQTL
jgi:hypothetical protein